jgi:hypothetical protein
MESHHRKNTSSNGCHWVVALFSLVNASDVPAVSIIRAIIILMTEAAGTSEKSVKFYQKTRRKKA